MLLVFYNYRYFKELALTTKQPLFLYAFWCGVTLILSPVALVLYVVAWVKFREVVEVEKDEKNSSTSTQVLKSYKTSKSRYGSAKTEKNVFWTQLSQAEKKYVFSLIVLFWSLLTILVGTLLIYLLT